MPPTERQPDQVAPVYQPGMRWRGTGEQCPSHLAAGGVAHAVKGHQMDMWLNNDISGQRLLLFVTMACLHANTSRWHVALHPVTRWEQVSTKE